MHCLSLHMTPRLPSTQTLLPSLQSPMSSCLSFQNLILATSAHETERIRCLLYLFTEQSIQLCAMQRANSKERVVRVGEVAKPTTGPKGQIDEGERPF